MIMIGKCFIAEIPNRWSKDGQCVVIVCRVAVIAIRHLWSPGSNG